MNARSHAVRVSAISALAFVLALALGACSHAPEPTAAPPASPPRESGKAAKPDAREPSRADTDATRDPADRDEPGGASDDEDDDEDDDDQDDADDAQTGLASYYATKFEGRRTASGAVYRRDAMTAAHRSLPFGTRVRVTRLATGKSVVLVVNDRGPFRKGRIVDVSRCAAEQLDLVRAGVARVRLDVLERPSD